MAVAAGYLALDIFTNPDGSKAKRTATTVKNIAKQPGKQNIPATTSLTTNALGSLKKPEIKKIPHYAQIWGRDPFLGELIEIGETLTEVAEEQPLKLIELEDYELTAISYRDDIPTILIDSEVLKIGDEFNGMTIHKVLDNSIILVDGNQRYIIKMKGSF
ncbi:MAG: hypothetical protein H8E14_03970 [Candidatus Marinimicrobia bacterium]|nr:hypothetical protein [Candidatus Neomarinimicrobiota bacterium]